MDRLRLFSNKLVLGYFTSLTSLPFRWRPAPSPRPLPFPVGRLPPAHAGCCFLCPRILLFIFHVLRSVGFLMLPGTGSGRAGVALGTSLPVTQAARTLARPEKASPARGHGRRGPHPLTRSPGTVS